MKKYAWTLALMAVAACGNDDGQSDAGASGSGTAGSTTGADGSGSDATQGADGSGDETTSITAGADGSTDDGAASGEGGVSCEQAAFSFELEPETPNVMLVLDKSLSMTNLWDHDADPQTPEVSRWNSLHSVVDVLTSSFEGEINFGAQLFPSVDAFLDEPENLSSCLVNEMPEVSVGPMTREDIIAAMPPADTFDIGGGTPAVAGITSAVEHLQAISPDAPRAVVFVTDGAANCNPDIAADETLFTYDDRLPDVVGDAFDVHQTPVYVVGINILDEMGTKPAVNPFAALSEVAQRGGVPAPGADPFFNAFNEAELTAALDEVVGSIECTITLAEDPDFPEHVEVSVEGMTHGLVSDCETEDGFVYTNPNGPFGAIRLCGAACEGLQGGATVGVDYLCPDA